MWLHTLERHLGWPTLQKILATYFERWKFRHPKPDDFFAVVNEISGQDLTWFFDQAYRSSNTFDYAIQDVRSDRLPGGGYRTTVVVRRHGEATFPVEVLTTFAGGAEAQRALGRDGSQGHLSIRASGARHLGSGGPASSAAAGRQLHQQQPLIVAADQ